MIYDQAKRWIFRHKFISLSTAVYIAISLFCIYILCGNVMTAKTRSNEVFSSATTGQELYLYDNVEPLGPVIRNTEQVQAVKRYYADLVSDNRFKFYERIGQPISVGDFKGTDKFGYGYEYGDAIDTFEMNDVQHTTVKQLALNFMAYQDFLANQVADVTGFVEDDFYLDETYTLQVLLGAEYEGVYEVGDVIGCLYYGIPMNYEVRGFLRQGACVPRKGQMVYLDRYMVAVSPTVTFEPQNEDDAYWQGALYFHKLNGSVLLQDLTLPGFINVLEGYRLKHGMFELHIMTYPETAITSLKLLTYASIDILIFLAVVLFVFAALVLVLGTILNLNQDRKNMRAMLVSGLTTSDLRKIKVAEFTLLYCGGALVAAIAIFILALPATPFLALVLALALLMPYLVTIIPITSYAARFINKTVLRG